MVSDRQNFKFPDEKAESDFRRRFYLDGDDWQRVEQYRAKKERKADKSIRNQWIERLQEKYVEEGVALFLSQHFKEASGPEKTFIREQLAKETKAPGVSYDYSLDDIIRNGLPGVRKHRRRVRLRYFLHSWAAIKALFSIWVVFLIYSSVQSAFEVIVCSLLIRMYTQLIRTGWHLSLTEASFNHAGFLRYLGLKEAVGGETKPDEWKGNWDLERGLKDSMIRRYVVDAGNSIVNLIVYWQLLKVLVS